MRSFWLWLLFIGIAWFLAVRQQQSISSLSMTWSLLSSACFFALYFLFPLLRKNKRLLTLVQGGTACVAIGVFWPVSNGEMNLYVLLLIAILAGHAYYLLSFLQASIVGGILFIGLVTPIMLGISGFPLLFIFFYFLLLTVSLVTFKNMHMAEMDQDARYDALLSEYRKLKRRVATDESRAREEERVEVGREIHDSVGHKLTALVMQLEVERMASDHVREGRIAKLKTLAKESLEETRRAVKAMKNKEVGGVSAIMRLIRQMEAENYLRIHFSVKHGAFTAPLTNNQTIAVYRAVQEALTNVMRHSHIREAKILFDVPGGRVFRFEVSNPASSIQPWHEGFGITSMKERMKEVGGECHITHSDNRFIVKGTLPLKKEESV
ncbi:histidine kinase [Salipaludibacillus sp. LMS25]|jgi:signal transduction histidine kinase|uniref:sensor histidine kinase n=1 Tax=Salipaludibacillus sp. LMS25 TaxID=2924031 RepID=UPI0020D0FC86|nr:histidine kinase [Salipaludibacillus sp. LMS25]UTR13149.1 histidine kinase [Salipaludibacillus sp. LMS25]